MTLSIPLWGVVTILYVIFVLVALNWPVKRTYHSSPFGDVIEGFLSGLPGCMLSVLATFAYLIFWIIHLAVKK